MSRRFRSSATLAIVLMLATARADAAADVAHIFWKDLRPATQAVAEDANLPMIAAKLPDHGETLSLNLQDKTVQLSGYALPVDREGDLVYQFLLVPWTGACSHMPTPPPNQIVLVTPAILTGWRRHTSRSPSPACWSPAWRRANSSSWTAS